MIKPKITIVTICYNSEKYIEQTIKSIINQSYDCKEYIIIDGGSTDDTLKIIEKYRDRIDCFVSEPDKGISDAFNKGIKMATGDIVGLINSDDILCENCLSALALEYDGKTDIYRGNSIFWNDITDFKGRDVPTMKFTVIPYSLHVCHQSTFISKDAYEKYGYYRLDFKYMMDLELLRRFYRKGATFKYVNIDLSVFRLGGISQVSETKKWKERKRMILINDGNYFHVVIFKLYLILRQVIKFIVTFFGEDFRLRFVTKNIK
jgi:glycosyltransferase involved in cell wall biosynthesis